MAGLPFPAELNVIIGCMYASKTSELQFRIKSATDAGLRTKCFSRDTRYGKGQIVNHDGVGIQSEHVENAMDILNLAVDVDVIGIDEGQFYGPELVDVCKELVLRGVFVIVAGLDQDYLTQPFEIMTKLMVEAEHITKLTARCACGAKAIRNFRKVDSDERIVVGSAGIYEARCRRCYINNTNNLP